MTDEIQIPENILSTLEVEAKQKGKNLNEIIEEYKKTIKINKQTKEFFEIIKKIGEMTGQSPNEIIKEAFKIAGVKIPNYQYIKAIYSYKGIKENDFLVFDMDDTELEEGKIYLFSFELVRKKYLIFAEYSKELNSFILDDKSEKIIEVDECIEILGALIKIKREIDL